VVRIAARLVGEEVELRFAPDAETLGKIRSLPARRFDGTAGAWYVPHTVENWQALAVLGIGLPGIPYPTRSGYTVDLRDGLLRLAVPYSTANAELCRRIPDHHMWHGQTKTWAAKPTRRNLAYLRKVFPAAVWNPAAEAAYQTYVVEAAAEHARMHDAKAAIIGDPAPVTDYKFGGPPPMDHQRRCFLLSRDVPAFAILMEQGTGKTKVVIDTACWLHSRGKITQALVIAPNSVKTNWVTDELPLHTPDYVRYKAVYWRPGATGDHARALAEVFDPAPDDTRLRWLVMNVEALSTTRGFEAAARFLKTGPTLLTVDESSRIKSPGATRTRNIVKLGRLAPYRRICSGMPITQGPLDYYTQFKFLDPNILGFGSFYAYRNHYAIMGGFSNHEILGYAHLDELQRLVEPYSFRVLREDCLDLPPKIYQKLTVDAAPEQGRIYRQMRDEMMAELAGQPRITVTMVLTQLLRLQQIVGGFVPLERVLVGENGIPVKYPAGVQPIPGPNPKLEALTDFVGDLPGKVIIWARFRAELDLIATALRTACGPDTVVEFHGGVDEEGRITARTAFQDPGSAVRFFVGQTETGGLGLTLTQAKTVIYYSNSFSLESRAQSEDRAHRIGQTGTVTYVDIVMNETVDLKLLDVLRRKQQLAASVTGDAWKAWL